tara:strand:- start:65 stop:223 length:159 start_codon:yes stop_codon:yes gene_type:complete
MPVKKKTMTDAVFASLKSKSGKTKSLKKKKTKLTLDEKIIIGLSTFLESPFK